MDLWTHTIQTRGMKIIKPIFFIRLLCFWRFSVTYSTVIGWFFLFNWQTEKKKLLETNENIFHFLKWEKVIKKCLILTEKRQKHDWQTKKTGFKAKSIYNVRYRLSMDYVRDGEIQGSSFVFLKVHCPSISGESYFTISDIVH